VEKMYGGYAKARRMTRPARQRLRTAGKEYLEKMFPKLDTSKECVVGPSAAISAGVA